MYYVWAKSGAIPHLANTIEIIVFIGLPNIFNSDIEVDGGITQNIAIPFHSATFLGSRYEILFEQISYTSFEYRGCSPKVPRNTMCWICRWEQKGSLSNLFIVCNQFSKDAMEPEIFAGKQVEIFWIGDDFFHFC